MVVLRSDIRVRCPDGRVLRVRRNVEKAFPLYVSDYSAKVDAVLRALEGVDSAATGVDVKKIRSALTYEVDYINRSLMANFRFAYEAFRADPCRQSDWFATKVDQLILEDQRARHLFGTIDRIVGSVEAGVPLESVAEMLEQLVTSLQISAPITNMKMEQAARAIDRWDPGVDRRASTIEVAGDAVEDEEVGG